MAMARNRMFFSFSVSLMLCVSAYILFRLLFPLPLSWAVLIPISIIVLLASQAMTLMRVAVACKPQIPFWLMRVCGYICAVFIVLFTIVLLRDGLLISFFFLDFLLPGPWYETFTTFSFSTKFAVGISFFSICLAAVGMYGALKIPAVRCIEVLHKDVPIAWNGTRIVHLSDLHIGSTFNGAWLGKVVERCNGLDADFVFITGDLVDGIPQFLGKEMACLQSLQAKEAVLIGVGNHEYYSGLQAWVDFWQAEGHTVLINENRVYGRATATGKVQRLLVGAVADPTAKKFPGMLLPDPKKAIASAESMDFRILLAHQPKDAPLYARTGFDLQLAGHTHGGQYYPLFPLVTWLNKYRSGLYQVENMALYVSPGTGLWGYVPMRVGSPSEITLITLRCKTEALPSASK